jgi:hypothetical protein
LTTDEPKKLAENELDELIADDERLERFVPGPFARNGVLRWQALKLRKDDDGGMSVGRLRIGVPALRAAGDEAFAKGVAAFAETTAATMRGLFHGVISTPGPYVGHSEIRLNGLDPDWPAPAPYEPGKASEEALAMVAYYTALLEFFRFRSLEEV